MNRSRFLVGLFTTSLVLGLMASGTSLASVPPGTGARDLCEEAAVPTGSGSASDPYLLANFAHLTWLRNTPAVWNSTFRQVANIDAVLSGQQSACTWTTGIGTRNQYFQGTFDGNGFTIANLSITDSDAVAALGFVNYARGATLQSVSLVDAVISGFNNVGGLIGFDWGSSSIKASSVSGTVMAKVVRAGGLVGRASSTQIVNSFSAASVFGSAYVAGIVGENRSAGTEIINSYFAGQLSASDERRQVVGSIVALGSDAGITDSVWNSSIASDVDRENGLARTSAQMKKYATYADIGWRIADGWAPSMPWSICSTVNDGFPFHSARFKSNPCPSLNASPAQLESRVGVPMQPIVMQVSGFRPASFTLQEGSLPRGLTLDPLTGTISGTPAEAAASSVVITGRQGSIERSATVTLRIRKATQVVADATDGACERKLDGTRLTITCADPGEYEIAIPEGATVVSMDAFGADGSRTPYIRETLVLLSPTFSTLGVFLPGRAPGGLGGRASLDQSRAQGALGEAEAVSVVVGRRGSGGYTLLPPPNPGGDAVYLATLSGGGYSAILAAGSSSPLLVAGGGGGGLTYSIFNNEFCGAVVSSLSECLNSLQPLGAHSEIAEPPDDWRSKSGGQTGFTGLNATQIADEVYMRSWGFQGLPGASFGVEGARVSSRSSDVDGTPTERGRKEESMMTRVGRDGRVVIVLDLEPQGDPAGCTPQNPQLGRTILCDRVGLSRVNVPAGADVARVNLVGAGGGSAGGAAVIDGGTGAAVDGVVDVRTANYLDISVGAGGQQRTWSNDQGEALFSYGTGGGSTSVRDELRNAVLTAGGGGGAIGATASSATSADLASISPSLTAQTAGGSATTASMAIPAIPQGVRAGSASALYPGGQQGASGWLTTGVNDPIYSFDRGSFGGDADKPAGVNGFALLRFCGLPGAPTVTSVAPGGSRGQATVDVTAARGSDGGCAPTSFQFRTSSEGPWTSAPGLTFAITQELTSGQSVCVQMRAQNEAGWSPASPIKCGNARNTSGEATGGFSGATITVSGGGSAPTSITVGIGGTFVVTDTQTTYSSNPYLRAAASGAATVSKVGGGTCLNDSTSCVLTRGGSTSFTVAGTGDVVIYNGNGTATTITIS